MVEMKVTKPFLGMFTTFIFMFSTMYTLLYFWFDATGATVGVTGLVQSSKDASSISSAFWLLEWILDLVSWISPFALVRGLVSWILEDLNSNLFTLLDLLFLRPMSWISSIILIDFAISKIPTESGE